MPTFRYQAVDANGHTVMGKLAGASEAAILGELAERSLVPIEVQAEKARASFKRKGLGPRQLATAYQQVADLLRAGVPLMRAITLLSRGKSKPRRAEIFRQLAEAVSRGEELADAMAAQEGVFPQTHIAMVRAGERGGSLEPVLVRLATMVKAQAELRGKLLGALAYPAVLVFVGLSVLGLIFGVFLPMFGDVLEQVDPMPPITVVLFAISAAVTSKGPLTALVLAALAVVLWRLSKREDVGRALVVARTRAPVLGPLVRNIAVARFCRTFGTMLANGVPVLAAMRIAEDAAGNVLLKEAVADAGEAVQAGQPLAGPLGESGLFDEDVIEMIAVGESANNLADVLETISETIEGRVGRLLTTAVALVGPVMLLLLAVAVAFVAVGLILPMLELSNVS
ncbi:MAG: type II secretion system F family protein [Phycisphaerales bacterium]|jgi:general secretion pathway protein F/type IV pilus assembly protein PilC